MLGGPDAAVAKMNAKAAALGAHGHPRGDPVGAGRPGRLRLDHAARPGGHLPRGDGQPGVRADHRRSRRRCSPTDTGDTPIVNQDELLQRYPGTLGGKTGFTDAARKTFVGAAERDGRRLVVAMMYGLVTGRPDLLGSGRRPAGLGLRAQPQSSVGAL